MSGLENLAGLYISDNNISDISPLSGLENLAGLYISDNNISDISPLSDLTALRELNVEGNPIDQTSVKSHIPALLARGVAVTYDEVVFTVADGPQIYNDNVFVLPVTEDLGLTGDLQLQDYVVRFYQHFEDDFDFLMLLSNLKPSDPVERDYLGIYMRVRNDVEGTGQETYSSDSWGATEKLQGVMHFPYSTALRYGPTLHELMHRWANFAVPTSFGPHWGISSANGQLGGFDINNLVDHGGGRYSSGRFGGGGHGGNDVPYSPIELYMAGFIPPEEVPDLWVAEDGEALADEDGNLVEADDGDLIFTASRVRTYTIEDIIAENGPRIPDHSRAQHDFRAAAILLIDENHLALKARLEVVSEDVSWFSHPGEDDENYIYNFYEATGGRGTITMNGLSQSLKSQTP